MNGLFLSYTKNKCSTKSLKVIVMKFVGLLIKSESELKKTTKQKTNKRKTNKPNTVWKEGRICSIY